MACGWKEWAATNTAIPYRLGIRGIGQRGNEPRGGGEQLPAQRR
jgi:hypothetical protein